MDQEFRAPKMPGGIVPGKRKATEELNPKGKQRAAPTVSVTVEDDDDAVPAEQPEDYEAPFAPGNDADYFVDEDEEGRFFGGGLSNTQKEILDIFEGQEQEGQDGSNGNDPTVGQALTVQGVRRQLLNLERSINKNSEMRVKWSGNPEKFVDSEVALDNAIQELLLLTQNPKDFYPELIKLGIVGSLVDLLSHENVDISLAVISVLEELTDDDVLEGEDDEEDDDEEGSARAAVVAYATALVDAQLVELVIDNLSRLHEDEEEAERSGVYHTLGLIENLLSLKPELSSHIAKKTKFIEWLLRRMMPPTKTKLAKANDNQTAGAKEKEKAREEDAALAQNRQYAAELLAIILQGVEVGRDARLEFGRSGGIASALKVLSSYRKRDPSGAEETEYMENVFGCLCSALQEDANKKVFVEEEGVELMVIMMKEKMLARTRAMKVLSFALANDAGSEACERFVDVLGLKSLFSAFMNKDAKEGKKKSSALTSSDEEHILSILVSLLSNLESDSVPRIRLLKKFVEDDYSKTTRLVQLHSIYINRVRKRESELQEERQLLEGEGLELDEIDEYLRRLDAGLYSLQLTDYILAWICMEDDGVRDHARAELEGKNSSFTEVVAVLAEYQRNIGDSTADAAENGKDSGSEEAGAGAVEDEASKQRSIVGHLMEYLRGC